MTAGILLAAGESRRFGGDKQLATFRGQTLLARGAQLLIDSNLSPRIVVLGGADAAREAAHRTALASLAQFGIQIAVNLASAQGISSSIRIGLGAALDHATPSAIGGVVITVCDQILSTAAHLQRLMQTATDTRSKIVASGYSGVAGVPAYFAASLFPELERLKGDCGAASILRDFRGACQVVPFPDGAIDIDTLNDLQCWL